MRREDIEIRVPIYECILDDEGIIIEQHETGEYDTFVETHIYSDEGKTFFRISTHERIGDHVLVGAEDSVDNYEEIDLATLESEVS